MTRYLELIHYRALAELRMEMSRLYLGLLWWVFEPLLYMAAFYVVFDVLFQRGGEGFVGFLLCGLVPWKWFSSAITYSSNSLVTNAALIRQVYVPKIVFPAIVVVTGFYKFLVVLLLLVGFLWAYGYPPNSAWFALPLVVLVSFLLVLGAASLVAFVVPFLPDVKMVLDNALVLLMFLSGIFFDISQLSPQQQAWFELNPIATLFTLYRSVLLDAQWPEWADLFGLGMLGLVLFSVSFVLFRRFDRIFPNVIG
jgi:lipopolysaccharide transport system permease protein